MRKLILKIINRYLPAALSWASTTSPDLVIGNKYLVRWWVAKNMTDHDTPNLERIQPHTRQTSWYNIYLHCVNTSDDERALHDHPWLNISVILRGSYREVYADRARIRKPGDIVLRFGHTAHRLEVVDGPVWSLFITGPKYREWGFRCVSGWRHWKQFTSYESDGDSTRIGKGCE